MLRLLRSLRRSCLCFTHNSAVFPLLVSKRFVTAAAEEPAIEEVGWDTEFVLSKRALMQEEGFTEPQIEVVLNLDPRSDKLAWLITILKDRGITGPAAGSFVSSHPKLLNKHLNQFFLRLRILEDEGISPSLVKKAILQPSGYLSKLATAENLQKRLSFLKELGLSSQDSFFAMLRSPIFLKLSIEKRLKPRCEFLYKNGVSNTHMCMILRNHPRVFSSSEDNFLQKLEFMEEFGLELKYGVGVRAFCIWTRYSVPKLRCKFEFLKSLGISHENTILLVKTQPWILCLGDENLKKRIEFFLHTLKINVKDLLSSSALFTCSLEKRVKPRFYILQDLKEKGLLTTSASPASVVAVSDAKFLKRFNIDPRHFR